MSRSTDTRFVGRSRSPVKIQISVAAGAFYDLPADRSNLYARNITVIHLLANIRTKHIPSGDEIFDTNLISI